MDIDKISEMEIKQVVGVVGSVVMFIGVFCPVEQLEGLGNSSFIGRYDLASILMLALATLSFVLALLNQCRFLWGTGIGGLVVLIATLLMVIQQKSFDTGNLQWGWLVLSSGAIIVIVSAVLKEIDLRK